MTVISKTSKLSILLALLAVAGFFIYQGVAGPMKINAPETSPVQLTSGLVGYWTFDGQDTSWATGVTNDKSGSGNNGQLLGMSTTTTPAPGVIGQALNFDGSDDRVNLGTPASLNFTPQTNAFSIAAWVKNNYSSGCQTIIAKGNENMKSYQIIICENAGYVSVGNAGSANIKTNIRDNQWHFVLLTVPAASSGFKFYVDGVEKVSNGNIGSSVSTLAVTIGMRSDGIFFNGLIDEVRVYNRVLSASEVAELYNQGAERLLKTNMPDTNRLTSGLVGYWTMDGQDTNWNTNITNDKSGQGNNGTITNMSTTTSPAIGKIGQALNFDGTDDAVDLGTPVSLNDLKPLTISVWVYPRSMGESSLGMIFSHKSGSIFRLTSTNALIYQRDYEDTDLARTTNDNSIELNKWQHTVVTWDGSTSASNIHIYVNGAEVSYQTTTNGSSSYVSDSSVSKIIGNSAGASRTWDGYIDEVRVYNRALSQSEITELYQQGQIKINASQANKLTSGLAGYWTFDGQDTNWGANTTNDRSSSGYNGTMTGMSTTTSPAIGKIGQALNFDGTDDYIAVGDVFNFERTNTWSVAGWINVQEANIGKSIIARWDETIGGGKGWAFRYNTVSGAWNYGISVSLRATESSQIIKRAYNVFTGMSYPTPWMHVAFTYDGSSTAAGVKFYVNGLLRTDTENVANNLGSSIQNSSTLKIGASGKTTVSSFHKGKIDEMRVYNRALSQAEVAELYNMGR